MARRRRKGGRRRLLLLIALAMLALVWVATRPGMLPPGPGGPDALPPVATDNRPPARIPPQDRPLTADIDRIVIDKSDRVMTAFRDGVPVRSYRIALGFAPDGAKTRQGDGKTPEGSFRIDRRNDRSAYHLSLGINYPQASHRARAQAAGESPGGDIFIHGQPNQRPDGEVLAGDWTAGCIAISDAEIRELFAHTPTGTQVDIQP